MYQIKDIPPKRLTAGITGYYAHGQNMSLGLVELQSGSAVPLHQHIHEQITFIIEGQLKMNIGGIEYLLVPGSHFVIPPGTWHDAFAVTDCKVIDAFAPVREDYITTG
ncbi:MAG: cupin domain-containing protein [Ferruginibacter sp.]